MRDNTIARERYKYSTALLATPAPTHSQQSTIDIDAEHTLYTNHITQQVDIPQEWQADPIINQNLEATNKTLLELHIPPHGESQGVITINLRHNATSAPAISAIHLNIILPTRAVSRIVVHHHNMDSNLTVNMLTTISAADGSKLEFAEITDSGSTLLLTTIVEQQTDSSVNISTIDINNQQLRRNQIIALTQPGAAIDLSGLYLTSATQRVDNYTAVKHTQPHCRSNQLYKGVVGESSTASFTGEIFVARDAQRTEALQQNHNILLGNNSRANSRPQLEIYADDVKCNHGATTGRTDPEAIYYMRQRGIPEAAARRLQLEGFVSQIIDQCPISEIHHQLRETISHRLYKI